MAPPDRCVSSLPVPPARRGRCDAARLIAALLLLSVPPAAAQTTKEAAVIVAIDGARGALVRWLLPSSGLPAGGYRVARSVDDAPEEIVATLRPGQTGLVLGTPWKEAAEEILRAGGRYDDAAGRATAIILTLAEPQVAAWLGLSYEDPGVRPGTTVTYTVSRLAADGSVENVVGTSAPVAVVPMLPPPAPEDFRAQPMRDGVAFFWTEPLHATGTSDALLYEIRREDGEVMGGGPLLKISARDSEPGAFDLAPGQEVSHTYTITAFDIFGRRGGESKPVRVFVPDFSALDPPRAVDVSFADGKAVLTWTAPDNPHRKGWSVMRALGPKAPGQKLSAEPQRETRFEDAYVPAGMTVYYRVAAVNLRGEEGKARPAKPLVTPAPRPVPPPEGLTAELVSRRLVILRWRPATEPVSGYYVERSTDGKHWTLLRRSDLPEPRYVDREPPATNETLWYRAIAWGTNDAASAPSAPLPVALPEERPAVVAAAPAPAPAPAPPPEARPAPPQEPVRIAVTEVRAPSTPAAAPAGPAPAAQPMVEQPAAATNTQIPGSSAPAATAPPPRSEAAATPLPPPATAGPIPAAQQAAISAAAPPVQSPALSAPVPAPPAGVVIAKPAPLQTPSPARPLNPQVTFIDGANGKVSLRFALPANVTRFAILRSESADTQGNVIASGLLPDGRGVFVDTAVIPGMTYYYRLAAFDSAGNRAPLEPPASVRVGAPRR